MHTTTHKARKKELLALLEDIVREELELARRQFHIARKDSRVGYPWYRPANLIEKISNCHYILGHHIPEYKKAHVL